METHPGFEILMVDDDQPIFELVERLGRELFPEARFVSTSSVQATFDYLDKIPGPSPQLVLLDIDLHQEQNGLDMLPKLANHFKGQVPIVMLTISDSPKEVRQAYSTGAVAYTKKPTDLMGWKEYLAILKNYWYEINLLPPTDPTPVHLLGRV
ncbi:response regulator [Spirosoma gilvum]